MSLSALLAVQLLVPLVLIAHVAVPRRATPSAWVLDAALAGGSVALLRLAGLWLALPPWTPAAFLALWALALGVGRGRLGRSDPAEVSATRAARLRRALPLTTRALIAVPLAALLLVALYGRRPFAEPALDLTLPFGQGTYRVANGGSTRLVNAHLATLTDPTLAAWRGQSYAVDLVGAGAWGSRMRPWPRGLEDFAIFGEPLLAPCAGEVVLAEDGHPDLRAKGEPPATLAGNHVILACDGRWVVLAHIMQGSVRVRAGDRVAAGDTLGRVGNSGRSDEPHLHIHAQTPGSAHAPLGGAPVPVTFDRQFLARNDRARRSTWRRTSGRRTSARGRSTSTIHPWRN